MTGKLFVDDIDIYTRFGIFILDDGYNGIVAYPPLKEPAINDWPEEHGIEVDLETPCLDTCQFSISFGILNSFNVMAFIELLSDGAYHEFNFAEIGLTKNLRLVSNAGSNSFERLGTFSLNFADDFPLNGFVYDTITPGTDKAGFEIDGLDLLASFKVFVLEGLKDELNNIPDVKENLLINSKSVDGVTYDSQEVVYREKELNVKCLFLAKINDNGRMWHQDYYNLLYALTRPNQRVFGIDIQGLENGYYKSSSVSKCTMVNDKIWIEFDLNLVLTAFVPMYESVLITEDGLMIETENELILSLE